VGGGLAGALSSAILHRAGISALLIDPHAKYPDEFRSEKLDHWQLDRLIHNGLAGRITAVATPMRDLWIGRLGHIVQQRANDQYGIAYADLINAVRAETPPHRFVLGKVAAVELSRDRQQVTLVDGRTYSGRLVIMADGLNPALRQQLGMKHDVLSPCHSISLGFDIKPVGREAFDFHALTYYSEKIADRIAYVTLFPMGDITRANIFTYRAMNDPWLRAFRDAPQATLFETMPRLERVTGPFDVVSPLKVRPIDLYVTRDFMREGVVVIGDAFANSCPAAGTGAGKAIIDADQLCNIYIPEWLKTAGMGTEKLMQFYGDTDKVAWDDHSHDQAFDVRTLTLDPGLATEARRWARFAAHLGAGLVKRAASIAVSAQKSRDAA
jgi:2-polyprenyl-6-methoxyphenol hydroxylase-like FAD-dependent oxidoreductase